MTLVVAKRFRDGNVTLSSDSRINFPGGNFDAGIKVFSLPVRIQSPIASETGKSTIDYAHTLGVAIAGSFINSYGIKESIFEILQNLQYAPGYTDHSFEGMMRTVFKVYEHNSKELAQALRDKAICQIVIAGYCPVQSKIRVFCFSTEAAPNGLECRFDEILKSPGIKFYGSGASYAQVLHGGNRSLSELHIIRDVVGDSSCTTVGGGLQFGKFNGHDFKVYGVQDYDTDENGRFKDYLYTLRGVTLYRGHFQAADSDFHVAYEFITPFQNEIDAAFKKQLNEHL